MHVMARVLSHLRLLYFLAVLATPSLHSLTSAAIYPVLNDGDADGRTPLFVGLIESYDPVAADKQLGAVGTVVGTEIAVDHINADETMLPGYRLHYNFINSQCDEYQAAEAVFKQVLNAPTKVGIIGAGCSPSTQNAALISQFYNLTQITCIATSPTLADDDIYRRYIQLLPPEFESAQGFYSIISYYGWQRVGVILQEADLFEKTFIRLRDRMTADGVELPSYKLHFDDLDYYKEEVFDFDNFIGIRIFLILSYESFAVPMLCEAYRRGFWYPRYHFILLGWYSPDWWKKVESGCTVKQIEQALQHSLTVDLLPDALVLGEDWEAKDLGITIGEFYRAEEEHISNPPPPLNLNITNYLSQYCYDATWAFAITLNKTIADLENNDTLNALAKEYSGMQNDSERFGMEHFEYNNSVIVEQMMTNWETTTFLGVTGNVTFKNRLRELLRIRITQYLEDDNGVFAEIDVGHLEKTNNFTIAVLKDEIQWNDGEPHDGSVDDVVDPLHVAVTVVFIILAILGIAFAVVCLLLNFLLREKLIIKLSSPKLNYMIGVGAILLYISIILVVMPLGEGDGNLASVLCCTTPWFTAIGYSLCYGTILVKMFRTWYIFNNPLATKKQVQDWMLVLIVMCLVVVDVIIMAIYTGLEISMGGASKAVNRENEKTVSGEQNLFTFIVSLCFASSTSTYTNSQEVVTLHYVYVCNSMERNATLGVLYGYKAVLQIIALLLSFATWNVRIKGLDDSKPIIVATYVTSLVLAVVIVSTYTLTEYINAYAAVFGVGFFLGTTLILCLVFMTKIYVLITDPEGTSVFISRSADVAEYRSTTKHDSQNEKRKTAESESVGTPQSKDVAQFKFSE